MKKLRGEEMDKKINEILERKINEGYSLSPISRTIIQKELGLKSRSTLLLNNRYERIDNARIKQLANAGLDKNEKAKRKGILKKYELLEQEVTILQLENQELLMKIGAIMYNLHARGYPVEEIMKPLRF